MTLLSVLPQGALQAHFHDRFWKSDHDFLIAFHRSFQLPCMISEIMRFYCQPDMMSSWFLRLAAFYTGFVEGIWKSDPSFIIMVHWYISRISYRFEVIQHFILADNCPFRPILGFYWGKTSPNFRITHFSSQKGPSIHQTTAFELLCCWPFSCWVKGGVSHPDREEAGARPIRTCRCCRSYSNASWGII